MTCVGACDFSFEMCITSCDITDNSCRRECAQWLDECKVILVGKFSDFKRIFALLSTMKFLRLLVPHQLVMSINLMNQELDFQSLKAKNIHSMDF